MNIPMDSLMADEPYGYWDPETPPEKYNFSSIDMKAYNFMYETNYGNPYPSNFKGILNPKRDKYGRCMEKYMIIVNWLQDEVGFDLDPIRYPDGKPEGTE